MLFAQAAAPAGGPPPGVIWAVLAAMCGFYLLLFIAYELVCYFFSRTVSRVLRRCHPDTRVMEPGLAYINMVPCVNYVWFVVTAVQVGRSLRVEFEERGLDDDGGSYGKTLGLTSGMLGLLSMVVPYIPYVVAFAAAGNQPNPPAGLQQAQIISSVLSLLFFMPMLALFIVYWVRIAGYGRQLADDDDMRAGHDDDRRLPPAEEQDHDRDN